MPKDTKNTRKAIEPVTRDYTIVLHKLCQGTQFKKKAPKALKVVREFAKKNMLTPDVRIDVKLNQFIWNQGIRNIPRRIRVRLQRKKDEEDESGKKFYTLVQLIQIEDFKGLRTEKNTKAK
jgi:large subunit ribosomal protein L31e